MRTATPFRRGLAAGLAALAVNVFVHSALDAPSILELTALGIFEILPQPMLDLFVRALGPVAGLAAIVATICLALLCFGALGFIGTSARWGRRPGVRAAAFASFVGVIMFVAVYPASVHGAANEWSTLIGSAATATAYGFVYMYDDVLGRIVTLRYFQKGGRGASR